MESLCYELLIQGTVQGQGVRPALARFAEAHGLSGQVCNTARGVSLILQGVRVSVMELRSQLRGAHPALMSAEMDVHEISARSAEGFRIVDSDEGGAPSAPVPRDVALCADCLAEFQSTGDRRYLHALISCTRCGPRFSSMRGLPFDRKRTTLAEFPLCADCQQEYAANDTRRRHAQTISCPHCGPQLRATDPQGRQLATSDAGCHLAAQALLSGQIVALRGVGGYQLLVDATNDAAVTRLRHRKQRRSKPFAVLCRDLVAAEQLGILDACARRSLLSPANPIVIVPRRASRPLAGDVHPGLNDIGLLLPTTAVHARLLQLVDRPLVCTSGNVEGAPLVAEIAESLTELRGIADVWLHHDRPIQHPLDDSVVRPIAGRAVTLRCARGLAPLPLKLPHPAPIVALGAFQKGAIAGANGSQALLGPHVGDLTDLATRESWRQALRSLQNLYQIESPVFVADGHPDDTTRRLIPDDAPLMTVWHHHAHLAAALLEHDWLTESVIGIAADGQGYGPDGQLWGCEVLSATAASFQRLATMRPFALCGGEAAVLDPGRTAVSLLSQLSESSQQSLSDITGLSASRITALTAAARARTTPHTSSLGRLFDAVAWLIAGPTPPGYVGEPAARLEAICDHTATGGYAWELRTDRQPWQIDWRPMLQHLLRDRRQGVSAGVMAERFHRGVARWMLSVSRRFPSKPLVLGGGVFQNRRLCELLAGDWPVQGPPLGLPGVIPPNDGGLAAGQLVVAAAVQQQYGDATLSGRKKPKCV